MLSGTTSLENTTIPNVYGGTECGRIKLVDKTLVGCRVVHEEHFGTICYAGELPKSKGYWLGVDWDNPSRGRHNGVYSGTKYFETKTDSSGSFIRPDKVSLGTSLEEALVYRYVLCAECQLAAQKLAPSITVTPNPSSAIQFQNGSTQPSETSGRIDAYFSNLFRMEEVEYSGQDGGDCFSTPFHIELFTTPAQTGLNSSGVDWAARHKHCGPQGAEPMLKRLRSASLTLVPVFRALRGGEHAEAALLWPRPGGTLGSLLPNLVELELSGCLLSKWIDVAEACVQIPWLKSLTVSNNRIRLPLPTDYENHHSTASNEDRLRLQFDVDTDPVEAEQICSKAFPNLCHLVLVRCECLDWTGLERIVRWTPSLRSLAVPFNPLGNVPTTWSAQTIALFRQLIELDLTKTGLTADAGALFAILGPSSTLQTLMLNQNSITELPEFPVRDCDQSAASAPPPRPAPDAFAPTSWFPKLDTLGLRQCAFHDWEPMKQLMRLPKLNHLMFLDCPVLDDFSIQTGRQELIARLPSLSVLNRVEITAEERRGAELDYLKRYGAEWVASGGTVQETSSSSTGDCVTMNEAFAHKHPVFGYLCAKHGAPDAGETKFITQSIKEGLVALTLVVQLPNESTDDAPGATKSGIVRRIPRRMTVNHLKMLVRRLFKLTPSMTFDLFAQGERHQKINAELALDADTREVGFYNLEDGDVIYVRVQKR